MASFQKMVFAEKLDLCVDFITSKYPNVGICVTGDKNDRRVESFLRSQGVKQIVNFSATKGNTKLDVVCTNLSEYYNEPQDLPPLGGTYYYIIKWAPLPACKVKYSLEKVSYRPLSNRNLLEFGNWITSESWDEVGILESSDEKAKFLQDKLRNKYEKCFPEKTSKRCNTDRPYITQEIKDLIRHKIQLRKEGKNKKC